MSLARYAIRETQGRQYPVVEASDRNEFQRDYTRVLHSEAFRRLQQKTQVFSANLGDLFRTRITHSLEVDQVSRSIARQLFLNEDLCGVLAIGHDIGHAPFGHMGQDLLDDLLKEHGGFEHNLQALRLVDELESPYPEHKGLNLTFEVREGLLKHCTPERALALGSIADRHLKGECASLEAQVVDHADALAYVHADLEDAFMMGLLNVHEITEAPGYAAAWSRVRHRMPSSTHPQLEDVNHANPEKSRVAKAVVRSVIREMMTTAIADVVAHSQKLLKQYDPQTPEEARIVPMIGFSREMRAEHKALKKFSLERIYRHPFICDIREAERLMLTGLFEAYRQAPSLLPGQPSGAHEEPAAFYRRLADHLSSMTDRYAVNMFEQILAERPELIPAHCRHANQAKAAAPLHAQDITPAVVPAAPQPRARKPAMVA
jgi:dGTPase